MADWHPEDVKAAVRRRGITLSEIGRRNGMSRQAIALTLVRPSAAGEKAIAKFLGVSAAEIWPSRHDARGARLRPQPPENYRRSPRFTEGDQ